MSLSASSVSTQRDTGDRLKEKFLTFILSDEEYAIGIHGVKEIIGALPTVALPRVPEYIKGVIDLRGKIIPIMDLRRMFGMESRDYDRETCFIVVNALGRTLGLAVDKVSEVLNIDHSSMEDPPDFGSRVNTSFILGMATIKGKVKTILDMDKVFTGENGLFNLSEMEG